mmetsp:Transcript_17081/g.23744  ORF Transcript_17081/g.23744 Transcript_17081/m.23744 type:complete len:153 (+) Transcript_17081:109-567(+)
MSLLSTVRILSRQGIEKNRLQLQRPFSALPIRSSLEENSNHGSLSVVRSSEPATTTTATTIKFLHKEVHYSSSLEETVERVMEMQKMYQDDDVVHETFQRAVRSAMYQTSRTSSYDRLCKVCGRDEIGDLCDICADGMTVSQFIPDRSSRKS